MVSLLETKLLRVKQLTFSEELLNANLPLLIDDTLHRMTAGLPEPHKAIVLYLYQAKLTFEYLKLLVKKEGSWDATTDLLTNVLTTWYLKVCDEVDEMVKQEKKRESDWRKKQFEASAKDIAKELGMPWEPEEDSNTVLGLLTDMEKKISKVKEMIGESK